ncbi:hypothetical protein [Haloarcula laminariae]|uniref:hypothetical protein n=1 Tax=Haloarcula laminariae TaxID=2961577 RepID=UPI002404D14F|nr:hypothetical protein [Halomicroarcula sp. FL173]
MGSKWVAAIGYGLVGLFLAITPVFLVDTLLSPPSLLQYVGGGLLVGLALGPAGSFAPLARGSRGRVLGGVGVLLGFLGLVGQFVL